MLRQPGAVRESADLIGGVLSGAPQISVGGGRARDLRGGDLPGPAGSAMAARLLSSPAAGRAGGIPRGTRKRGSAILRCRSGPEKRVRTRPEALAGDPHEGRGWRGQPEPEEPRHDPPDRPSRFP